MRFFKRKSKTKKSKTRKSKTRKNNHTKSKQIVKKIKNNNYMFGNKTPCFCYGSNSVEQLRERVGNPNIESFGCQLFGYRRFFAGNSKQWGGGVASIIPTNKQSDTCRGSFVLLSDDEFKKLDYFEEIVNGKEPFNSDFSINLYRKCNVKITSQTGDIINAIAYVLNNTMWKSYPSESYLAACYKNISAFWPSLDGDGCIYVYDIMGKKRGEYCPLE
jgi:hypothetical protein